MQSNHTRTDREGLLLGNARYQGSAVHPARFPPDEGAEVAFAGRSNAGKSSALNALCNRRALARTSRTPGRTQMLNFFTLDDSRRLVDLPGYGFARVPEETRRKWKRFIESYLSRRRSLKGLILLMDARHPLKPDDGQFLDWCAYHRIPVHVLLTKSDKLRRSKQHQSLRAVRSGLAGTGTGAQLFSARDRTGLEEARKVILDWLSTPRPGPCPDRREDRSISQTKKPRRV
jgi:GTP-binding protein